MTHTLAIDVGSSSVKAALLDGTDLASDVASAPFETDHDGINVEVPAERIDEAIRKAVGQLDLSTAERVGLTTMAPAWLAMDEDGRAITPIVTHQDRRGGMTQQLIDSTTGRKVTFRQLTGNVPTPGGISVTTATWFNDKTDAVRRAAMVGHLPTSLFRRLTGIWAIDPSNAGFTGMLDIRRMAWSREVCDAARFPMSKLPPIVDAATVVGETRENELGIPVGLPVFGGYVDGSGPLLVGGAKPGTMMHSAGSTDVLAVCVAKPRPTSGLLCRPLGTGGLWVLAATQAAGGSALFWAKRTLFADWSDEQFNAAILEPVGRKTSVTFHPHLAGDRQSVEQPTGAFTGLTLATTRADLLAAVKHGLVGDHSRRLKRLLKVAGDVDRRVITTGGGGVLPGLMRATWPGGDWQFEEVEQGTLRGLGTLVP
ncbi:MAG: FGGY family carbohydrate kinase [Planctomycetota bacterium]